MRRHGDAHIPAAAAPLCPAGELPAASVQQRSQRKTAKCTLYTYGDKNFKHFGKPVQFISLHVVMSTGRQRTHGDVADS